MDKKLLEEKLFDYKTRHKQASEELVKLTVMARKLEGAIEAVQFLIAEEEKAEPKIENRQIPKSDKKG